jgi:DNA-binding response OmpR family regulator
VARVLALTSDLLFGSLVQGGLRTAGHEVELLGSADAVRERLLDAEVLVVDLTDERLDGPSLVEEIQAQDGCPRTLGFYSHVDTATRERAREAGFDAVVPRSRMAREGGELVTRLASEG